MLTMTLRMLATSGGKTIVFDYAAFFLIVQVELFVAICLWLFSVSWSYDLYLVLRDGSYPTTWLANLLLSASLYLPAGLLWNLDWRPQRGVTFSFLESDWPQARQRPLSAGSSGTRCCSC